MAKGLRKIGRSARSTKMTSVERKRRGVVTGKTKRNWIKWKKDECGKKRTGNRQSSLIHRVDD